jgi:formate--tetrahydrofolate ligase
MDNLSKTFGANLVVTVNKFTGDSEEEIADVVAYCNKQGIAACKCNAYNEGPSGAKDLAELVIKASAKPNKAHSLYDEKQDAVKVQIEKIAKNIYGAGEVEFSDKAKDKLKFLKKYGFDHLPTIVAKTQYSLTHDAKILGAPTGFTLPITDIEIRTGAGFVVAICGKQLLMPALPKVPNANKMVLKGKDLQGV